MSIAEITYPQLLWASVFVIVSALASVVLSLGVEKRLIWASTRTVAQLFLSGFVLKVIFDLENVALILLFFCWMVFWASHTVASHLVSTEAVKKKMGSHFLVLFFSLFLNSLVIVIFVVKVIIQVEPWSTPQYLIPLAGMIVGNSMTASTIALDRMFSDFILRNGEIEYTVSLGASVSEASKLIVRDSVRAGMIPTINSLMSVGLVSFPGMMTGQILAGVDPVNAVKYQIVVMLMITVASLTASYLLVKVLLSTSIRRRFQI